MLVFYHFFAPLTTAPLNASPAETTLELSLDKAIALAVENSFYLRQSLIDLSMAELSANRIWAEVFPSISGSLGVSYASPIFTGGGADFSANRLSYSFGLGLSLGLNAGIPYAIRNIRLAYQRNLLSYQDARNQLEIQITRLFFSIIAERDSLVYLEDNFNLAQMQLQRNQVSFNHGLLGERVLLQSRLALELARYSLSRARSMFANNMGEFLALLGLPHDSQVSLLGEINIVRIEAEAEELIREHLPRRPDIISRRHEIERLENLERQTVLSSRAPSLNLSVNWGSAPGRTFQGPFADNLSGSAALSIPIDPWISGTRGSQSIDRAGHAVERAAIDLLIAEDAARTQIRSLTANLRNLWDSVEIARLSLTIAERNFELTEQGFINGVIESLVLEDARNNLADARQRLLQSELSYFNLALELSRALNINWKELTRIFGVHK